jgi:hypothetical protein
VQVAMSQLNYLQEVLLMPGQTHRRTETEIQKEQQINLMDQQQLLEEIHRERVDLPNKICYNNVTSFQKRVYN